MPQNFYGFGAAVDNLAAASSKGFKFSGPGAEALLSAVTDMQRDVVDLLQDSTSLAEELPLGQTPAAMVYKPFMASIATDAHQGFIPFLKKLQEDLASIEESLRASIESYEDSDTAGAQGIVNAGQ